MFYDHEFIGAMLVHEFQMGNDYFEKANPKDYTLDEIMKRTEEQTYLVRTNRQVIFISLDSVKIN